MENERLSLAAGDVDIVIGGRRSGKTTRLVKMAAETGHYMVVADKNRASYCMKIAHDLGLSIRMPMTFQEFMNQDYYHRGCSGFIIDDLDTLIRRLSPFVPIHAFSLTGNVGSVREEYGA